jgi:hypothetical protein
VLTFAMLDDVALKAALFALKPATPIVSAP